MRKVGDVDDSVGDMLGIEPRFCNYATVWLECAAGDVLDHSRESVTCPS